MSKGAPGRIWLLGKERRVLLQSQQCEHRLIRVDRRIEERRHVRDGLGMVEVGAVDQ